jgi:hypothetical protein
VSTSEFDRDVEASQPDACWSVQEGDWQDVLPPELAALVAPPVVVSAESFVVAARRPVRDNSRPAGYAVRAEQPRFLVPAPPLPRRNRRSHHAA